MSDADAQNGGGQGEPADDRKQLIDYPTVYAFKVMGRHEHGFIEYVRHLFGRLIGSEISPDSMTEQPSSKGTYVSVTVSVYLTSEAQRQTIYAELRREERVVYYL